MDYLIDHSANIIPVEVKTGATCSLKSQHQFMAERKFLTEEIYRFIL